MPVNMVDKMTGQLYRRLRNKYTHMVRKDRKSHQEKIDKLHIENKDISGLYKSAKSRMAIRTGGKPNMFVDWWGNCYFSFKNRKYSD